MIDSAGLFWIFTFFALLVLVTGLYNVIATTNMIRAMIGFEIMTKAVTLIIALAGKVTGNIALSQAFIITMIVIEVVIITVAGGIVISVFRKHGSINVRLLRNLKG
jgi:multisubunit Na+/H+ antiporter MnhC subunit